MNQPRRVLVVGVGSGSGDDQAGWLVVDQLVSIRDLDDTGDLDDTVTFRKAKVPLDIIDWLDNVDVLHICDACYSEFRGASVRQFRWSEGRFSPTDLRPGKPALAFDSLHHGGSHDFGVLEAVRLAAATGQLPRTVIVWAICGTAFLPDDIITSNTLLAVAETTKRIRNPLQMSEQPNA